MILTHVAECFFSLFFMEPFCILPKNLSAKFCAQFPCFTQWLSLGCVRLCILVYELSIKNLIFSVYLLVVAVVSHSAVSDSLKHHELQSARLLCPWNFRGKNTEVGCHFLIQGIFLTQGSNPRLLHWQADSLLLSHLGFPRSRVTDRFNLYSTKKIF